MNADQLMVPVYINEKIVLDILAIVEDGFSTVSQVSYTEHKENNNAQKLEAGVSTSATLLSKLLKSDLKGELQKNPLINYMDIFVDLFRMADIFAKRPQLGGKTQAKSQK